MVNQERRSFLRFAIHSLGALFGAVLGIPAACYLIDARNRPAPQRGMRPVQGIRLDDLQKDVPAQGVIRDIRRDAWTLHPNDVIGRVWVVKTGNDDASIRVLTTICPHLGCFVNNNPPGSGPGFTCPCHSAKFNIDGSVNTGPQQRGMDTLEWQRDDKDRNLLLVRFESFIQNRPEKVAQT